MMQNHISPLLVWLAGTAAGLASPSQSKVVPVTIVSVIIGNNPSFGYDSTTEIQTSAFKLGRSLYPQVFQDLTHLVVYRSGNFNCIDAGNEMILAISDLFTYRVLDDQVTSKVILSAGGVHYFYFLPK